MAFRSGGVLVLPCGLSVSTAGLPAEYVAKNPPKYDDNADRNDDRRTVESGVEARETWLKGYGGEKGCHIGQAQDQKRVRLPSVTQIQMQETVQHSLAAASGALEAGQLKENALGEPCTVFGAETGICQDQTGTHRRKQNVQDRFVLLQAFDHSRNEPIWHRPSGFPGSFLEAV